MDSQRIHALLSRFSEQMRAGAARSTGSLAAFARSFTAVGDAIATGQRFYLPDAVDILEGREYDEFKSLLRLPYECTVLLSETTFDGQYQGWKLSVGVHPASPFNAKLRLFPPDSCPSGFAIIGTSIDPRGIVPFVSPMTVFVEVDENVRGIKILSADDPLARRLGGERICHEMADDVYAMLNLCALLGLRNVKTRNIDPPERLNKARMRRGKLPLYSYHVLHIDGDKTDQTHEPASVATDRFYRSHLRRGHIRRLPSGHVFVRAAFVRGREAGFVDKDYAVKSSVPMQR